MHEHVPGIDVPADTIRRVETAADPREEAYQIQLKQASWQVKVCKLADVFDNLMDTVHLTPKQRARTFNNAHRYLDALQADLPEQARQPWQIVAELLAELEAGEAGRAGGA